MYKDKSKQREANRKAMRRKRIKSAAVIGDTRLNVIPNVIPKCGLNIKDRLKSDQRFTRLLAGAGPGHVRVSKPGDADYVPMCETTRDYIEPRTSVIMDE